MAVEQTEYFPGKFERFSKSFAGSLGSLLHLESTFWILRINVVEMKSSNEKFKSLDIFEKLANFNENNKTI